MSKKKHILLSKSTDILIALGENVKLARLRRKLSGAQVAERANISLPTLWSLEKGSPGVSIATYLLVLTAMGLEDDLLLLAKDDLLGRKLQDAGLISRQRAPKRNRHL